VFKNRIDAAIQLASRLMQFKKENLVILAIPRGGLPIGAIVAKALNAPLDIVLTKKIGHPNQKEYAIGAVSLENIVLTETNGISQEYIDNETSRIRKILNDRYKQYYRNKVPTDLKDKTVIIIDDGIATGNTLLVTIALVKKQKPKKIIVAIPVAPNSTLKVLETTPGVDKIICLLAPMNFRAVGQFYETFPQVSDKQAIQWLEQTRNQKNK
tara:strand:+ start:664 stop:1299 length:636 start_codon:yes stop_codon:yes gene_type:complete